MLLDKATNLATQRVLREKIAAQIEAYLANGGKITDLPGFQTTPPRCLPVRVKQTNNPAIADMKRYRRPRVVEGQIKMQKGRLDGDADMCIYFGDNVPRCDRALVMNVLCGERQRTDPSTMRPTFEPSLIDELEARGYDMDTLQFSIKRKEI